MFSFIFRLITLSSFILGIFFCNNSFALPSDKSDKEWNWLIKHKFLVKSKCEKGCSGSPPFYKNLNNNRVLIFNYDYDSNKNIQFEEISISCGEYFLETEVLFPPQVECLDKIEKQFNDNKDKKIAKIFKLIYDNEVLNDDLKNAKLYKKGFKYFYLPIDGNINGVINIMKKLKTPIEEKIYMGKKFDYIISNYKILILKKNEPIFKNLEEKWKKDLELKTKLENEIKKKKLDEEKQKVFNLDSDEESDSKNIDNKKDNLTGFYAFGDYTNRDNYSGVLSVKKVSENKVYFEIVGYRGKPSYNQGIARGEIELINNKGTFNIKDSDNSIKCSISFNFTDNKIIVNETAYGFECGFGNNVSVEGTYNKITNNFDKIEYP